MTFSVSYQFQTNSTPYIQTYSSPALTKDYLLMSEVVAKYLPEYRDCGEELRNHILKRSAHYKVEHLVEEAMAYVGGYQFVNESHYDFSDKSDSKTCTISFTPHKTNGNSYPGVIGNIMSVAGVAKEGAIRAIIYNPHTSGLVYAYLPKAEWDQPGIREYGKANAGRIRFTYNKSADTYSKIEPYIVPDFESLAKAKG